MRQRRGPGQAGCASHCSKARREPVVRWLPAEKLQDRGCARVVDLDVINSAIGMEIEIHLDRAGDPGAVFNLFAPGDTNRGEEAGIVIAITSQPNINAGAPVRAAPALSVFILRLPRPDLAC